MTVIAIANQKGGCGKTTTAINLAAALGQQNKRVLLIDMDSQGHATLGLGLKDADADGLYEVFSGASTLAQVIRDSGARGVDIIPATISLAAAEHMLGDLPNKEHQLSRQLARITTPYDFIIIDCPPALGMLSINALMCAQHIIIPVEASVFAVDGIERLLDTIDLLNTRYELDPTIEILPTMVDMRTRLTRDLLHTLQEKFRERLAPQLIHYTIRLKEAAYHGRSIFDYVPNSQGAQDYQLLAQALLTRYGHSVVTDQESVADISALIPEAPLQERRTLVTNYDSSKPNGTHYVTLSYRNIHGANLKIAGDFNGWVPDRGVETRQTDGALEKIMNISPGHYQYRVIIDGKWQEDPENPLRVPNGMGGNNSILEVPKI